MSAEDDYQSKRLLHAYHEAGHALVGHVIGRCIEEVSIAVRCDGYGGYCRFNALIEDANDHPEWRDDAGNPDLVTIYYAGMLATAYACVPHLTYDEEEAVSCTRKEVSETILSKFIKSSPRSGSTSSSIEPSRMQVGHALKRSFPSSGQPWTSWRRRSYSASGSMVGLLIA
jgi:hypothetical protein